MASDNIFSSFLNRLERFTERRSRLIDLCVVSIFVIYSLLFQIGSFEYYSIEKFVRGDAANILSIAAAKDHPDMFEGDIVFGNAENFEFYKTVHISLLRSLYGWLKDYADALLILTGLHAFLYLSGFYLLGIVLFRSRFWAFILPWLLSPMIWIGWGTFWGLYKYPLPRVSYAACLGFLWAAAIYWRKKRHMWPMIMFFSGILVYVHPVSAPIIAFSLLIGFAGESIPEWSFIRRLGYLFISGLCFLVPAIPFVINYLGYHEHESPINYYHIKEMLEYRNLIPDYGLSYINYLKSLTVGSPVLPIGIVSIFLLRYILPQSEKDKLRLILFWMLGIFICAFCIYHIDHYIAGIQERPPLQYDLMRGMRFFVPLFLILFLWLISSFENRGFRKINHKISIVLTLLVGLFLTRDMSYYVGLPKLGLRAVVQRKACLTRSVSRPPVLDAIERNVPPGRKIFSYGLDPLAIRYGSLRPVVFCMKDGGLLGYANLKKMEQWYWISRQYEEIQKSDSLAKVTRGIEKLADSLDADYLVIATDYLSAADLDSLDRIVWSDQNYAIIKNVEPLRK